MIVVNHPRPDAQALVQAARERVEQRQREVSLKELESMVAQEEPPRNFFAAVTRAKAGTTSVIAEVRRRDWTQLPEGWIRPEYGEAGFRPETIAQRYDAGGAAAISCVTEERFLDGNLGDLRRVKDAVGIPVMRWDVLVDPYQIWESRAFGADAVLLRAECLTEAAVIDQSILATRLGMTVVLQVHDLDDLLRFERHVGFPLPSYGLLCISNHVPAGSHADLRHSLRLAEMVEDRGVLVSAGGIGGAEDLARLRSSGIHAAIVGRALLRAPDPGLALRTMLEVPPGRTGGRDGGRDGGLDGGRDGR